MQRDGQQGNARLGALRSTAASTPRRQQRDASRARCALCAAVCAALLFAAARASFADGGPAGRAVLVAGSDENLDSRLRTTLVDQPRWLRGAGAARATRLFLASPSRATQPPEATDARRVSSRLPVRELSFPTRRVAVGRAVARGLMFNLSVGLDRELERGGIGEITPSFGLQLERRFQ